MLFVSRTSVEATDRPDSCVIMSTNASVFRAAEMSWGKCPRALY